MGGIFVLAEHRGGKLREVSLEMLGAAAEIAPQFGGEIVAVLMGSKVDGLAETLAGYSDKVLYIDDPLFENYNAEKYQIVIADLMKQYAPELLLVGHTAQGIDMAPALAVQMEMPYLTDIIGLSVVDGVLKPVRSYYQGKLNADFAIEGAAPYLITVRESSFIIGEPTKQGTIERLDSPLKEDIKYRRFIEYLEAIVGDVDITQADVLVSVGRGIKEPKNLEMIQELAEVLGATISASRAAVDAGWLPHERQVGTSGKTVKPKVYLAIGISGAFEHVAGMKGAKAIIAINKDPNAPIFSVASYGIVDDLFKVVPKLTEKIKELKS